MNANDTIWKDFTNLYPVSKTLRFELRPIGKTKEFIDKNGLIEEDHQREKDFNCIKKIMDEYYKVFIEEVLSQVNIDNLNLISYNQAYSELLKDKYNLKLKKNLFEIQKKIRLEIYSQIKDHPNFRKIFGKEFISVKGILVNWLNENGRSKDSELVSKFNSWTTYFRGFFKNRANIFSKEDIPTSIIYRIVNDNLTKYLDNLKKFEKLQKLEYFSYKEVESNFKDELNGKSLDCFFKLDNFNSFLNQKGIDLFNLILGGKTIDKIKYRGLNEIIYLYSQKISDKKESKKIKYLKLTPLFKQILSDKGSFSSKFDIFENTEDIIKAIDDFYKYYADNIKDNIKELMAELYNSKLENVYIKNDKSLKSISKRLYGDYNAIKFCLEEYFNKDFGKKNSEKWIINQNYISIKDVENSIKKYLIIDKDISNNPICDYFNNFKVNKIDLLESITEKYNILSECNISLKDKFNESETEKIKEFLDSMMDLLHFVKPLDFNLKGKKTEKSADALELDANFYDDFNKIYNGVDKDQNKNVISFVGTLISIYNKTRNFATKKRFSVKKFKLNFNNSTLLDGWDINKEEDNYSVILQKGGFYYLGIMTKDSNKIFKNFPNCDSKDYFEKMNYKLLPEPYRNFPRVFFSKKFIDDYPPSDEILEIRNCSSHTKNGKPQKGYDKKEFNIDDCHKMIDFFKESLSKYSKWSIFNFKFKDTCKYNDISEFYKDVESEGYLLYFTKISNDYISNLVDEGKLYLFKIWNKDFSKYSKGKPNLHTMYWKSLFSKENLKDTVYKLNGKAEIFYRKKSLDKKVTHPKNELIINKDPIKNKRNSIFKYDLFKDKHYMEDKFLFYCPLTINFKSRGDDKEISKFVNKKILDSREDISILGIDRGERNLIYCTLIDSKGKIINKQSMSLNGITDDFNRNSDYHEKLDNLEGKRGKARKSWSKIENIKDLKEGYLSQVIHKISKIVIENNAIVVLEDLNFGFKKGRFKIEKQIYQKFEKMLINKLNYLVFKDKDISKSNILKGYQLTNKLESFQKLGKQSGILYYVPASFTSKIDPKTGFVNLLYPNYKNVVTSKTFFNKFNNISYLPNEDLFSFSFNYSNFLTSKDYKGEYYTKEWTLYSNGPKLKSFRNLNNNSMWDTKKINITEELKKLFGDFKIDYSSGNNLIEDIEDVSDKKLYVDLINNLKLILQLRNSVINSSEDYILSCVKDKNGNFFNSKTATDLEPKDADANGAYHIALKGLMLIQRLKSCKDVSEFKNKKKITRDEFLDFVLQRNK